MERKIEAGRERQLGGGREAGTGFEINSKEEKI